MKKVLYLPVSPEELNRQTNITTNYQRMIADDMRSTPNGQTRILSLDGDNLLRASSPTGLQLLLSNRSTNTYLNAIAGIVGDVDTARYLQTIPEGRNHSGYWKAFLSTALQNHSVQFNGPMPGKLEVGVITREEYQKALSGKGTGYGLAYQRDANISDVVGSNNPLITPTAYIPICRCDAIGLRPNSNEESVVQAMLQLKFLPLPLGDQTPYGQALKTEDFWRWLKQFLRWQSGEDASRNLIEVHNENEKGIADTLSKIKRGDFERANLPEYRNDIFQPGKGCWELWKYADITREEALASGRQFYDLSALNPGIFAQDPCDDTVIARDNDWVAIDFGTKNTTVAVLNGVQTKMIPVGMQRNATGLSRDYENPTILQFEDIQTFLDAYLSSGDRPNTRFADIPAGATAEENFHKDLKSNQTPNLWRYLTSLKQWTNDPNRVKWTVDNKGGSHQPWQFQFGSFSSDSLDPVELYAYYIGLSLNNMHNSKIYLKYLLSYSATYAPNTLSHIKESFERGLKKSLPPGVMANERLKRRFEVRSYLDEATAYAISAWIQYSTQASACLQNNINFQWPRALADNGVELGDAPGIYEQELHSTHGAFYAVYDFGGGTLDFSFGLVSIQQNNGKPMRFFRTLESGGRSNAGCENLLEELAYHVFLNNKDSLTHEGSRIPFLQPFGQGDENSLAARQNTCNLMKVLREECWMKPENADDENNPSLYLYDENNGVCTAELMLYDSNPAEKSIPLYPGGTSADSDAENPETGKKYLERWMKQRIEDDIKEFFLQCNDTVDAHPELRDKSCFVFMGGNASRSDRVQNTFRARMKEEKTRSYYLHPPLKTEYDEKVQSRNYPTASFPGAKSGVVCGMLMANPNSMLIKAETMRECIFQYHIGVRTFDGPFLSPFGWFERRIAAKDFERGKYYRLEQIPPSASTLELLCTNLRQYGMGVEVRDAFHTQPIIVTFPENRYENCYLYGCVVHNSDSKLYLGVSKSNVESLLPEQITDIIGACDCASGIFYPFDHSWDASFRLSANGSATPWMKLDGLPSESNVTPCLRLQQPTSALELMYYSRLDGVERRQTISLYPQAGETPIQSWADVFCYDGNSRDGVFRLSVADNDGILMNREIWMNL